MTPIEDPLPDDDSAEESCKSEEDPPVEPWFPEAKLVKPSLIMDEPLLPDNLSDDDISPLE